LTATTLAADQFHPEFYVTVATVLPLLLLVTNLVRVYVSRWPANVTAEVGVSLMGILSVSAKTTLDKWFPRAVAIVLACLNVAAEVACLIVLFRREGGKVASVIIWVGVGCSLAWVLLLLITYILADKPEVRE
jgi:hypothetical protein